MQIKRMLVIIKKLQKKVIQIRNTKKKVIKKNTDENSMENKQE